MKRTRVPVTVSPPSNLAADFTYWLKQNPKTRVNSFGRCLPPTNAAAGKNDSVSCSAMV
jgi:hypothetical protein